MIMIDSCGYVHCNLLAFIISTLYAVGDVWTEFYDAFVSLDKYMRYEMTEV